MREIKFRGQRVYTCEWVHGDLVHRLDGKTYILPKNWKFPYITNEGDQVSPDTVSQLVAKTVVDQEVYEGDLVHYKSDNTHYIMEDGIYEVGYGEYGNIALNGDTNCAAEALYYSLVVGNKWDSPEMLAK